MTIRNYGIVLFLAALIGAAPPSKPNATPTKRIAVTDLKGKSVYPLEGNDRVATVLLFITPDCPISNAYAPEVNAICKEYGAKRIVFYLVYVATTLSDKALAKHAKDFEYRANLVTDRKHSLAKFAGATVTPEVAVFSPSGKRLYLGRIDDRYVDFGKKRVQPTVRDLREALGSILKGENVKRPRTTAVGCFIPED